MLLTDILEVKKVLNIPISDTSMDYALNYYIQVATSLIAEFLDRGQFYVQSRTEYYNGSGTQKLLLKHRPVFIDPEPQAWTDLTGMWGEASDAFSGTALTFGTDFGVWLDTVNPTTGVMDKSRCGILVRKSDYWAKPSIRQQGFLSPFIGPSFGNVKVIYTAGYSLADMPAQLRMACIETVAHLKYLFPLGLAISSESYEERHITLDSKNKNFIFGQVKHLISSLKNWRF